MQHTAQRAWGARKTSKKMELTTTETVATEGTLLALADLLRLPVHLSDRRPVQVGNWARVPCQERMPHGFGPHGARLAANGLLRRHLVDPDMQRSANVHGNVHREHAQERGSMLVASGSPGSNEAMR